jgi:hypothetical protein
MRISIKYLSAAIIFIGFASSCSTSKLLKSELNPHDLEDIQLFHPVSKFYHIDKGNRLEFNDSLSRISKLLLLDILRQNQTLPWGEEIVAEDGYAQEVLNDEITLLFHQTANSKSKNLHQVVIPPMITSLLAENGKRFGILTATTGFNRRKGNYGGQILKGIGIGVLTMGMYYPVPIKANSFVEVIIVDNNTKEVAFFRRSQLPETEPLNKATLHRQLEAIFKGYIENDI